MTAGPKLRFGILCNGRRFAAWEADCIKHLIASGHAEPALLIRDATPAVKRPRSWRTEARTALYRLYDERWVRPRLASLRPVDLTRELAGVEQIDCVVSTQGRFSQVFSARDVDTIRGKELDFILRFGFNIIRGDILQAARHGVWSYHHDNELRYRGGPPCFWEIFHGDPVTGAILQRLTDRLDGGIVLHRGFFGTCKGSWRNNIDRAFFGSADWCARVCAEIATGQTDRLTGPPSPSAAPVLRAPTNTQLLTFWCKTGVHLARKLWELLFHLEVWNVGFTDRAVSELLRAGTLDNARVTWCKPHAPGHFIADPFVFDAGDGPRVLVEDFDHAGKGRICELVPPYGPERLEMKVALEPPHHLSYPCLFAEEGALYCVPEAYQANGALLHRRVDGAWSFVRRLIDGAPVVDPTLFRHRDLYWLLFTLQDDGAFGNLKLYGYYASALDADWRPHALNPLKCDIGSARPAGTPFLVDGALHRPSMDCSATYGGALIINRVLKLSPTEFEEVAVARLEPTRGGPYPHGLHTLNSMGPSRGAVIDGKRLIFDPLAWRQNRGRLHEVFI
jgi:hypothetical protein